MRGFIGVHIGAGTCNEKDLPRYKKTCKKACMKGSEILNSGGSVLNAVTVATEVLENASFTNAGYGSNLTLDGMVECDASVMDGSSLLYGSCGAVSGIKNPVKLAKLICDKQRINQLPLGRIPPCSLVGHGALRFAEQDPDIEIVSPTSLISAKSRRLHEKYKNRLECFKNDSNVARMANGFSATAPFADKPRLDTVGAVCVDQFGNTAAACSSGGIILKHSGRIGPAAVYGCGCWAENRRNDDEASIALATSGCGEYIIKTCLARDVSRKLKITRELPLSCLNSAIKENFVESPFLGEIVGDKQCGLIAIYMKEGEGEFLWAHTTRHMCIGYMNTSSKNCVSQLSQLPDTLKNGCNIVISGVNIFP